MRAPGEHRASKWRRGPDVWDGAEPDDEVLHAIERTGSTPGQAGLLDLSAELGNPRPGTAVYCCGPEPLLAAVERACAAWPAGILHVERFFARPDVALGGVPDHRDSVLTESERAGSRSLIAAVAVDQQIPDLEARPRGVAGRCPGRLPSEP
ncbi:ferredoxin reductase domain-containing protein [Prauserella endophytica]|uniref:hypothetical protein n=1 Tax=Prauserella endophytica TaxID=1592324 RepID=UPI00389A388A